MSRIISWVFNRLSVNRIICTQKDAAQKISDDVTNNIISDHWRSNKVYTGIHGKYVIGIETQRQQNNSIFGQILKGIGVRPILFQK